MKNEPFGYWVEQKGAEPALLRKPAYIPEPSDLRKVTPLFTSPAPSEASADVVEVAERILRRYSAYEEGQGVYGRKEVVELLQIAIRSSATPAPQADALRTLDEWHEDYGDVVWWKFPITEPAMIGNPLDSAWPGYHTHWTPHPAIPAPPLTESQTDAD